MYKVTRLNNGLTVATAEMPHMTSVSLGIWVGVGARYEPAELNGTCHFIEHLLFKGTERRTARQISEAVEGIGGYLNAFTSEESTCFHARICANHFAEVLDVLMDMLLHSRFAPREIGKEREVIKEEISMYLDEPQHHVQELLNATLWPGQALGRSITGSPRTLDRMHRASLVSYLSQNYVSGSTVVVASGRITHAQHLQAVKGYAAKFSRGDRPCFAPARADQREPRFRLVTKQTTQTQIALGIRTCSRHDPRRYALRLLNAILGENMSSRLFQVIREDRGLAYSIYSTLSFFADTGDLVISAGLDADNLPQTLKLVMREIRRLCDKPPGRTDLQRALDYAVGQIDLAQESTEAQMNWVGEQLLGYGRISPAAELKRRLQEVSAAQVQSVARDFFQPARLNLAMVSPVKRFRGLAELLG